ncbi:MAG: four helix bundle protein [Bacteroidetes bacterium]|nr:four helix bundle protein [Bacteroidota bacterium]
MNKEELKKRTKYFSIRVFKFLKTLPAGKDMDIISYQLFKASSSVGANYRAVCRSKSSADFLNKLKVVDEEADESLFWLEFIDELELKCYKKELEYLKKEANELVSIFSSSIKTLKSKNTNGSEVKILNP